ncbi:MAG: hypothetical protein HY055_10715 [Magnetospirillum sp.]|nr:hypothetical protein [Magnetospirillum sp.]
MPNLRGYARTRRFVIVVAATAIAVTWLLAGLWLWIERQQDLSTTREEVERMSMVAAEQTRRLFSLTSVFMDSLEQILTLDEGDSDPTANPVVIDRVKSLADQTDHAIEIGIADHNGLQRILPILPGRSPVSIADRDYFRDARSGSNLIAAPVKGRTSGEWIIPVSRRLKVPTASADVIYAAIHLPALETLFSGVTRAKGGGVALLRSDGIMLARTPFRENLMGASFADSPLFTRYLPEAPNGTFVRPSAVDQIERLTAYRSIPSLGLVVTLSVTVDAALAEWRREVMLGLALALSISGLIILAATVVLRLLHNLEDGAVTLDQRVKDRTNDIEGLMEARSAFLTSVSHELRTPLNAIIGFSDALIGGICGPVSPRQAEYLGDIHNSGRHLLSLVNDLLDSAAIDAGRLRLDEETVALDEIVAEAVSMVRQHAEAAGLFLDNRVDPHWLHLNVDRRRLLQALLNLCSNAVKYNRPGGWIQVGAIIEADGTCVITVADNGIGMTEDERKLALMPFGRATAPGARQVEGTGLGLPLTANIIALHGGSLWLESTKGQGTEAHIRLPGERVLTTDQHSSATATETHGLPEVRTA